MAAAYDFVCGLEPSVIQGMPSRFDSDKGCERPLG